VNRTLRRLAWVPLLALALWSLSWLIDLGGGAAAERSDGHSWNPPIQVHLGAASGEEQVRLEVVGRWQLRSADGKDQMLHEGSGFDGRIQVDAAGIRLGDYHTLRDGVWLVPEGDEALRLDGLSYDGRLLIGLDRDRRGRPENLELSLELPLESYVLGVVCGEMPTMAPDIQEALRAQAVAARSYALWRLGQGRMLRDDARDQVYKGADFITNEARAAVGATRGLVLFWENELVPCYFHRNCGGLTADARAAGFTKEKVAPLAGVLDETCRTPYGWERRVAAARFDRLAESHDLGESLTNIHALQRDASGRMLELRLQGEEEHHDLPADQVRGALRLPSSTWTAATVLPDGSVMMSGRGYGHGVGMCQEGALDRAREGASAEELLAHYYPGAALHRLSTEDQRLLP
jgi:stage II sporulation protein D